MPLRCFPAPKSMFAWDYCGKSCACVCDFGGERRISAPESIAGRQKRSRPSCRRFRLAKCHIYLVDHESVDEPSNCLFNTTQPLLRLSLESRSLSLVIMSSTSAFSTFIPRHARAAVVEQHGGPVVIRDVAVPSPAQLRPGEALVKVEYSGVCHTE